MRTAPLWMLAAALTACVPKSVEVQDMPAWRTEQGALELKYELLDSFVEKGATREAQTLIRQLRDEGEDDALLDLYQGMALAKEGFLGEAERILQEYRKKAPRDMRALKTLALIYADTEEPEAAIELLQKAVEVDKQDAEAWNNLGFLLFSQRQYPEAEEALQTAVELDGTKARYRNNLGFAMAANGHWRQAFEAFQSAGQPEDAHYNLALAYELQDKEDQAVRHYEKAVEYNPNHLASQEALARLHPPEEDP